MGKKQKAERANAKGWSEGVRDELVLIPQLPGYMEARQCGTVAERRAVSDICNRFHTTFPYWLEDHEEYYGPHLPYDANKIYDPCEEVAEENKAAVMGHIDWMNKVLTSSQSSLDITKNPLSGLLLQLGGFKTRPRRRSAQQEFQNEQAVRLQAIYSAGVLANPLTGSRAEKAKQQLTRRDDILKKEFAKLTDDEVAAYDARAIAAGNAVRAEYDRLKKEGPSKTPESRQKAIAALPAFVGNVLRGIQAYTGLQATLLLGGPIPSEKGELRVYSVFAGKNLANATWPEFDSEGLARAKDAYLKYIESSYTSDDIEMASLAPEDLDLDDLIPLEGALDDPSDNGSDLDSSSDDEPIEATSKRKRKGNSSSQATSSTTPGPSKTSLPRGKPAAKVPAKISIKAPVKASVKGKGSATSVPIPRGKFDITKPKATFSLDDEPGETEGYRRLLWEQQRFLDRTRYYPGNEAMKNAHIVEWMDNHYVDDLGRVRDRSQDVDSEDDLEGSDWAGSDDEGRPSKKQKKASKRKANGAAAQRGPSQRLKNKSDKLTPADSQMTPVTSSAASQSFTSVPDKAPPPAPSKAPSPAPSQAPSPAPSKASTPAPSKASTPAPSKASTPAPSRASTPAPSNAPTPAPSNAPAPAPPSNAPTPAPANAPTPAPANAPTPVPSNGPAPAPSNAHTPTPTVTRLTGSLAAGSTKDLAHIRIAAQSRARRPPVPMPRLQAPIPSGPAARPRTQMELTIEEMMEEEEDPEAAMDVDEDMSTSAQPAVRMSSSSPTMVEHDQDTITGNTTTPPSATPPAPTPDTPNIHENDAGSLTVTYPESASLCSALSIVVSW
ncbi:hypothetical protein BD626DRAFT_536130 [Schizophyllum amplum]|uniref:Uncharacterized protein n=1 Tax=Schizophyllum amplum TaxID=97359 RepID=A0A550CJC5_9AGAR|nr:hypothetical protein BD626DRAFT_536130 [Auriculariopsis ampla]